MQSQQNRTAYRTALALNNAAVGLMEQGKIVESLKTLSDALTLFKAIFHPADPHDDDDSSSSSNDSLTQTASHMLHVACQRSVVSPLPQSQSQPQQRPNGATPRHGLEVWSMDDHDRAGLRSAAVYGPSSSVVVPVRLRSSELSERWRLEHSFGCVLYNHGVAHLLRARQQHEQQQQQQQQQANLKNQNHCRLENNSKKAYSRAVKSLQLAHAAFSRVVDKLKEAGNAMLVQLSEEIVSSAWLSVLSLNVLAQALKWQQRVDQAYVWMEKSSALCNLVEEVDTAGAGVGGSPTVAAPSGSHMAAPAA